MDIVPLHHRSSPTKHFVLTGATLGSNSYTTPGTGYVFLPVAAWLSGSAQASVSYYNGTAGSELFRLIASTGGYVDIEFYEEPSNLAANKAAVLESNTGIGSHNLHVWAVIVRGGAGSGGTDV